MEFFFLFVTRFQGNNFKIINKIQLISVVEIKRLDWMHLLHLGKVANNNKALLDIKAKIHNFDVCSYNSCIENIFGTKFYRFSNITNCERT